MKKILILLMIFFATDSFATGISGGTTAPCDNDTLSKYNGTVNAEINWEPNTINLNWYDGDTKLTVQNSSQTCTYDGTITVPPQPTKPGYTFNGWKVIHVPGGYTELEYVEGGSELYAFIDLGFPPTPTMQTLLTASVSTDGYERILFGASDNSAFSKGNTYAVDIYDNVLLIPNGKYISLSDGTTAIDVTISLNTIYKYKINYPTVGTIGVNDITKTAFTNLTTVSSNNLYVFTYMRGMQSGVVPGRMKLYGLTLWDQGDMIHNYIPARRNSDNVVGIYDTITQAFLTSFTSGSLVAGPVVQ